MNPARRFLSSTLRLTSLRGASPLATFSTASTSRPKARRGRKASGGKAPAGGDKQAQEPSLTDIISKAGSDDDLNKMIDSIDSKVQDEAEGGPTLPINIGGAHAEYAELAYVRAAEQNKSNPMKGLEKISGEIKSFWNIVRECDYSIHRFFFEPDYLPKETIQALNLLLTEDVKLNDLDSIQDDELREYFLADEEGMKLWNDARKAVKKLKLSKEATSVLDAMANAGDLHLIAKLVESFDEIIQSASTTAKVRVESAVDLTEEQKKEVQNAVKKYLPENKKEMDVEFITDKNLVGGLMIDVDDRSIDLSSATILMAMGEAATSGASDSVTSR